MRANGSEPAEAQQMLLMLDQVPVILELLESSDVTDRAEGVADLAALVERPGTHIPLLAQYLRESGAVELLCELLREPDRTPLVVETSQHTLLVLGNLCSTAVDPDAALTKEVIGSCGVMVVLTPHLLAPEVLTQMYTAGLVQNLCTDGVLAEQAVREGVARQLEKLLRSVRRGGAGRTLRRLSLGRMKSRAEDRLFDFCSGALTNISNHSDKVQAKRVHDVQKRRSVFSSAAADSPELQGFRLHGQARSAVAWRRQGIQHALISKLQGGETRDARNGLEEVKERVERRLDLSAVPAGTAAGEVTMETPRELREHAEADARAEEAARARAEAQAARAEAAMADAEVAVAEAAAVASESSSQLRRQSSRMAKPKAESAAKARSRAEAAARAEAEAAARARARAAAEERERIEAERAEAKAKADAEAKARADSAAKKRARAAAAAAEAEAKATAAAAAAAEALEGGGEPPKPSLRELVATTRQVLGAVIETPVLTGALLSKPPFRFLHDIVSEVTRATGFAEGLYDEEELSAANVNDKKSKEMYLVKIVKCVEVVLGEPVDVRPGKIVCGFEPENTNLFLQALARAATSGVDSSKAVTTSLAQLGLFAAAEKVKLGLRMTRILGTTAPSPAPAPATPPPPAPAREPSPEPVAEVKEELGAHGRMGGNALAAQFVQSMREARGAAAIKGAITANTAANRMVTGLRSRQLAGAEADEVSEELEAEEPSPAAVMGASREVLCKNRGGGVLPQRGEERPKGRPPVPTSPAAYNAALDAIAAIDGDPSADSSDGGKRAGARGEDERRRADAKGVKEARMRGAYAAASPAR